MVPGNHFLTPPPAPMFGSGGPHVAATDTFVTRRHDLSLAKATPFFGTILRSYMVPKNGEALAKLRSYIGEGNGTPLQYSCLENPMDGGAW